jgi:hypothetical protein
VSGGVALAVGAGVDSSGTMGSDGGDGAGGVGVPRHLL